MLVNATLSIRLRALRDAPGQSFQQDPDLGRDVLHTGTFSTGYVTSARSTSAAKAMAARIPSVVRRGCSDRIWVRRFSRCQLVQDQLNRDPGPGKAGFAHHDLGVGDD